MTRSLLIPRGIDWFKLGVLLASLALCAAFWAGLIVYALVG